MNLNGRVQTLLKEFNGTESRPALDLAKKLYKLLPPNKGNDENGKNVWMFLPNPFSNAEYLFIRLYPKDLKNIKTIFKIIDDFGYYPTEGYTTNDDYDQIEKFKNPACKVKIFRYLSKGDSVAVQLEKFYDDQIDINRLKYVYHATPIEFLDDIQKNGLNPISGSKLSYHPKRIYVTADLDDAEDIGEQLAKHIDKNLSREFAILKISTQGLNNKFYHDPNYAPGAYTDKPIPSSNIKLIKTLNFK